MGAPNHVGYLIVAQSLESELNGLLGKLRETAGTGAMKALPWVNR